MLYDRHCPVRLEYIFLFNTSRIYLFHLFCHCGDGGDNGGDGGVGGDGDDGCITMVTDAMVVMVVLFIQSTLYFSKKIRKVHLLW